MTALVAMVLALVSIYVIGYPFLRSSPKMGSRRKARMSIEGDVSSFGVGYDMRGELESDYRSGILSREEYEKLETDYVPSKGATAGETPLGKAPAVDEEIEKRVREIRQKKAQPDVRPRGTPAVTGQRKGVADRGPLACSKCGQAYREGDRFCTGCGARLKSGGGR